MKQTFDLEKLKQKITRVLAPIIPANDSTLAKQDFLFSAERSRAGRELGSYYLVYFLLVDLLKFENLGQFEKVAWSIPIDYLGKAYLIEYRKMGIGVFVQDKSLDEPAAAEITKKINKAIGIAEPYFEELAKKAITESKVNLINKHGAFFSKYLYFLSLYEKHSSNSNPKSYVQKQESVWLAIATIESFFSWSEHVFIHLALLTGRITSGPQTINLISDEWDKKFKAALDINNPEIGKRFNELILIKNEIRNFVAHGGAGKNGEALYFHSGTGAVPVLLPHKRRGKKFVLGDGLDFDPQTAIEPIKKFIDFLWSNERKPAHAYICKSTLPTILTYVSDGTYLMAMKSNKAMDQLIVDIEEIFDRSTDMDW